MAYLNLSRTDRIAKYDRLMRIEIELGDEAHYGYEMSEPLRSKYLGKLG